MQNKGLIKFITVLFALVCLYQLSFTFVANGVEKDAKAFAKGDFKKEAAYLDSIRKEKVYPVFGFTYDDVRNNQINKGLDLEGGINVILQISVKDILKGLANDTKNPAFNKALADAKKNQQGNQSFIDAFLIEANKAGIKLADAEIFGNRNLNDVIKFDMTNAQVEPIIKKKVTESVESAYKVLRERIDKFGVLEPNIQMLGGSGRILIELPGAKDIDRIKKLLQSTAQLEFWETYKVDEIGNFLIEANEALKKTEVKEPKTAEVKQAATGIDSLLTSKTDTTQVQVNPLFDSMLMPGQQGAPYVGIFKVKDTAKINSYLNRSDIRSLLPANLSNVKFAWGKINEKMPDATELYALKGNRENKAPLGGNVIVDARDTFDQLGKPAVSMQMNGIGAREWEKITGAVSQQGNAIAIVLDNIVYSAPGVSRGAITGGQSEISGSFTLNETKDLANILRAGKLPAAAEIVQSEIVGPSLGQAAIDAGISSSLVGLFIIALWMVFFYGRAGWFANIALTVNILFLFGILASFGAVLSLPGIAGIVLTIGTAVDANVLIYERAKESLREGHSTKEAIKHAFSWEGAMSAITDANVTTALTGIVLFIFGTGPIKGFATTLLIGIATSLFTAIFVTRLLVEWASANGKELTFSTPRTKMWLINTNFDFLGKKKIAYIFSSILMVFCIGSLIFNGMNQGVDFVGGRTFQVKFDKTVDAVAVSEELTEVFGSNVSAKVFGNNSQLKITTKYKVEEESSEVDKQVNEMLYNGLKKYYKGVSYEQFVNAHGEGDLGIVQATKVGPSVAKDVKTDAYWAVLGSLAIVFLYLALSFRKWQYSLGAVVAVAHDAIFVLGVYSFFYKWAPFSMEVDQSFIAGILTVIGYSLNDTVIVFDRVREYVKGQTSGTFEEAVNDSINATLSRTFNTSATVLVVLLIMFIFGGESIRGFVFSMLLGIGIGTYSSYYISTPILVDTVKSSAEREREANIAKAKKEEAEA